SVRSGADVITFSGDKLLGGPQAGIILGRKEIMERLRKSPLTRALRVDKFTLAALEATLRLYRDEETAVRAIPTLRMIALDVESLATRAQSLADRIRVAVGSEAEVAVVDGASQVGGGALPVQNLPSKLVALTSRRLSAARLEANFRGNQPPIIGRVEQERYLLDVRTLQLGDDEVIVAAAARVVAV
ncbi:MAG: L-seryl-tRNA(Sec) selenium transferase, partial [Nitrospirota bacterium]